MRRVRLYGAAIAFVLLIDFLVDSWLMQSRATSLYPALIGSVVMLAMALGDAASRLRRRLVAVATALLTISVAASLALTVTERASGQALLLAAVLIGCLSLTVRAAIDSRKRRGRRGLQNYYVG